MRFQCLSVRDHQLRNQGSAIIIQISAVAGEDPVAESLGVRETRPIHFLRYPLKPTYLPPASEMKGTGANNKTPKQSPYDRHDRYALNRSRDVAGGRVATVSGYWDRVDKATITHPTPKYPRMALLRGYQGRVYTKHRKCRIGRSLDN